MLAFRDTICSLLVSIFPQGVHVWMHGMMACSGLVRQQIDSPTLYLCTDGGRAHLSASVPPGLRHRASASHERLKKQSLLKTASRGAAAAAASLAKTSDLVFNDGCSEGTMYKFEDQYGMHAHVHIFYSHTAVML
jgi:hypothetical protein